MPKADELPEDLKPLTYQNAALVGYERFRADAERLIPAIKGHLERAQRERQRKREEQARLDGQRRQKQPQPQGNDGLNVITILGRLFVFIGTIGGLAMQTSEGKIIFFFVSFIGMVILAIAYLQKRL